MNNRYKTAQSDLRASPATWLVTGAAGFIGSNLVETLLRLGQRVIGLDNYATGNRRNLDDVRHAVAPQEWKRFTLQEGDIGRWSDCHSACAGVDFVLHQAGLGSVPRSLEDPLRSHATNVNGFLNMLVAARDSGVRAFVYASSSSVYGDHPALPKIEENIGSPLSPYAATKRVSEIYADVFARSYGRASTGLRYFNVFGPRQDPNGAYAAVIPRWFAALLAGHSVVINGDGETSRDFCYVENVVQANILAAVSQRPGEALILNVAYGERTTLNDLYTLMRNTVIDGTEGKIAGSVVFREARAGDVRHSLASLEAARQTIGYEPGVKLNEGLRRALTWYRAAASRDSIGMTDAVSVSPRPQTQP
jgi:UDP-N-acetylglucosamine/UDP-N-acetylgalactosamine 4-epimerase